MLRCISDIGALGSIVGWSRKVAGLIPDAIIRFFHWPWYGPVIDSASNGNEYQKILTGDKGQPARNADNLNSICETIVYKIWEPRILTTLWTYTARYRDRYTF
jgi:hypothetical protein